MDKKLLTLKDFKIQSLLCPYEIDDMVKKYDAEIMLLYNQGANDFHGDMRDAAREWVSFLEGIVKESDEETKKICESLSPEDILKRIALVSQSAYWIRHFFNLDGV